MQTAETILFPILEFYDKFAKLLEGELPTSAKKKKKKKEPLAADDASNGAAAGEANMASPEPSPDAGAAAAAATTTTTTTTTDPTTQPCSDYLLEDWLDDLHPSIGSSLRQFLLERQIFSLKDLKVVADYSMEELSKQSNTDLSLGARCYLLKQAYELHGSS